MPETLEAEVIEVDGQPFRSKSPEPRPFPSPAATWSMSFDRKWWPLWILVGSVALVVGGVLGLIYAAVIVLRWLLRAIFR
jgi:hypothetical protein